MAVVIDVVEHHGTYEMRPGVSDSLLECTIPVAEVNRNRG